MDKKIPFSKPCLSGNEIAYVSEAVRSGRVSGDGPFSRKCSTYFAERFGFHRNLLTTSCTDALEMAALLLRISPGDEVIVPSYTFVSSANAFALRGAKIVLADSLPNNPNIDPAHVERLVTERTRAIVVVHYAGVACAMDELIAIADNHGISIVEDCAQAIDSCHRGRPLGTLGRFAAFSFHATKNIVSGEGGLLVVRDEGDMALAEVVREKGTDRADSLRRAASKYEWVDLGSSFLPSDIIAAYLLAQLEMIEKIQSRRVLLHERYSKNLAGIDDRFGIGLPDIPSYATNNAHMFYVILRDEGQRNRLIKAFSGEGVSVMAHYMALHRSPYFTQREGPLRLRNAERFQECLLRLPLYFELSEPDVDRISELLVSQLLVE